MKPGILLLAMLLGCTCCWAQQPAVDIDNEPHYHLLLANDQVRVFLLTLHTDESAYARFQHSVLTVALQDGEVIIWDEGKSPIQHYQVRKGQTSFVFLTHDQQAKGVSGGFKNDRPGDYRNITVEFLDPDAGWAQANNGTISPPSWMFIGGALITDVLLQPNDTFSVQTGDPLPASQSPGGALVIPLADVHLKSASGAHIRSSIGEVAWIAPDLVSDLTNVGREAARFIAVQLRPGDIKAPSPSPIR